MGLAVFGVVFILIAVGIWRRPELYAQRLFGNERQIRVQMRLAPLIAAMIGGMGLVLIVAALVGRD